MNTPPADAPRPLLSFHDQCWVFATPMTARVLSSDCSHSRRLTRTEDRLRKQRGGAHLAAAIGLVLALGGCVSVADQVSADIDVARSACRAQTFRTNADKARCHNAAEVRLGEIIGADLAAVRRQARLVIAEKTDRKQLTEAEGELEFAKVNADLTTQALRRLQDQQLAEAQTEAAIARRRSQGALQTQPTYSGSFECVSHPGLVETRTECRDTGVNYVRTNPAIR